MLTVEELGQEIAELAVHLDSATHRLLECVRQFDADSGWAAQGALSCAHWLAWRIGLDPATAREKVRVARALGTLPKIDAALKAGKLSYAKTRALTRVATPDTEENLLEAAIVVDSQLGMEAGRQLDALVDRVPLEIVAVTREQVQIARQAYLDFGKGNHPAGLNFGDCFAYALARVTGEPLLFKGNDFAQSDVAVAHRRQGG